MIYEYVQVNSEDLFTIYNKSLRFLADLQSQAQHKHDKDLTVWHNFTLSEYKAFTELRDMFYSADIIEYTQFMERPIKVECPVNKIQSMLDECVTMLLACNLSPYVVLTQDQVQRVYYFKEDKYISDANEYLSTDLELTKQYTEEVIESCKKVIDFKKKYSLDTPEKPEVRTPNKVIIYSAVCVLFLVIALFACAL